MVHTLSSSMHAVVAQIEDRPTRLLEKSQRGYLQLGSGFPRIFGSKLSKILSLLYFLVNMDYEVTVGYHVFLRGARLSLPAIH